MRIIGLLATLFLFGCGTVESSKDCSRYAVLKTAGAVLSYSWEGGTLETVNMYFVIRYVECRTIMNKLESENGFVPTP